MTLRNLGLALLLIAGTGLSGEAGLRAQPGAGSQMASELLVFSLRELSALFPFPNRPAESAITPTAGLRG